MGPWMGEGSGHWPSCTCSGLGDALGGHSLPTPAWPWLWISSKLRGDPSSLRRYLSGAQSRKPAREGKISSVVGIWGKEVKYSAYSYSNICTGWRGRWWGVFFYPGRTGFSVSAMCTGKSHFEKLKQQVFPRVVFSQHGTCNQVSYGFICLFPWAGTSPAVRPVVRQGEVRGSQREASVSFPNTLEAR